jgi:hypothetical protein
VRGSTHRYRLKDPMATRGFSKRMVNYYLGISSNLKFLWNFAIRASGYYFSSAEFYDGGEEMKNLPC